MNPFESFTFLSDPGLSESTILIYFYNLFLLYFYFQIFKYLYSIVIRVFRKGGVK